MIKKKRGFWTFIFALIPGAGEMYMGFFKQGASIMAAFWLVIALASYLDLGPLLFLIPLIWFYSFFHTLNLSSLPDEEFYTLEDAFLFDQSGQLLQGMIKKEQGRKILAYVLIFIGISAVWNMISGLLYPLFDYIGLRSMYYSIRHIVPQAVFAVAIIWLGMWLIRGKKKELDGTLQLEDNASMEEGAPKCGSEE